MNIFGKGSFTWWQIGIFKLSVLTFGLAVGAYWQAFFSQYITALIVLAAVSGIYIAYVWFKQ